MGAAIPRGDGNGTFVSEARSLTETRISFDCQRDMLDVSPIKPWSFNGFRRRTYRDYLAIRISVQRRGWEFEQNPLPLNTHRRSLRQERTALLQVGSRPLIRTISASNAGGVWFCSVWRKINGDLCAACVPRCEQVCPIVAILAVWVVTLGRKQAV